MKLTNQGQVTPPIEIDYENVKKCIFRLKSLNHPTRRRILDVIVELDEKATSANIIKAISLEQKVVERHLAMLVKAKMISREKITQQKLIYTINEESMAKASRFIREIN